MLETFFNDRRFRKKHSVYARWCWTDAFSTSGPDCDLWKDVISRDDLQMLAKIYNAFETYEVLVTSEILDLQTTNTGSTQVSVFTEESLGDPASIIAGSESASRLAEALDLDEDLNKHLIKGSQMASGTALFNEHELQFLAGNHPDQAFFHGQSGKCVEWLRGNSKFCGETVMGNSDRCVQHRDSGKLFYFSITTLLSS